MDVFVFVVVIVAITSAAGIYREKMKMEVRKIKGQNSEEVERRFAEMEERIQTLERIVTDQKAQLRDKIDAL